MKIIALTFDYDLNSLAEIGRFWAKDIYKNKDFIYEYSAASYATFINKNPDLKLHLHCDDIDLIKEKLSKYNINLDNIIFYDFKPRLEQYKKVKYSFDILNDFIMENRSEDEYTVKIDNDLIFKDKLPIVDNDYNNVLVWKYERMLYDGDPRMGEIKASIDSIGNYNYPIYNIGLLGIPKSINLNEMDEVYRKMADVDILPVSDLKVNSWHCAEQTAKNWIFNKYNYNIVQTYQIVDHNFANKSKCIEDAKYLLK